MTQLGYLQNKIDTVFKFWHIGTHIWLLSIELRSSNANIILMALINDRIERVDHL